MEIMLDNNKNGEVLLKATMPLINDKDMITIDNNLQNIINEFTQKVVKDKDLALSQYIIKKQNDEKQQLISFLEEKIEENSPMLRSDIQEMSDYEAGLYSAYKEVLDFINKGGKDE